MKKKIDNAPVCLGIYTRYSEQGASSRLRYYLFKDSLKKERFSPEFHPFFDSAYLSRLYSGNGKSKWSFFKALVTRLLRLPFLEKRLLLEYELLPFMPAAVDLFFMRKRKFVLNFDDLVWEKYKNIPFLKNKYDTLISKASGVIVANHLLLEKVQKLNSNVILIPTVVDLEEYTPVTPVNRQQLTAAWIGTPVTYRECFLPFAPVWQSLCRETGLQIKIIARHDLPVIDGVNMTCLDWSRENEARLLSECDFGIMPLRDDDFSRGKSAYKLIQYAATGLPAIASPVGENKYFITPGENGFTASSAEEWIEAVRQLADLSTRQKMAAAMQNKAFEYSLQKYAPVMAEFLLRCFS